jgi:hypothetical protein
VPLPVPITTTALEVAEAQAPNVDESALAVASEVVNPIVTADVASDVAAADNAP